MKIKVQVLMMQPYHCETEVEADSLEEVLSWDSEHLSKKLLFDDCNWDADMDEVTYEVLESVKA